MTINNIISERLTKARTEYNQHGRETMKEVADSADVPLPMTTISAMENGKSQTPQNLRYLAVHYGVPMDYLFGMEGAVPNPNPEIQAVCKMTGLSEEGIKTLALYAAFDATDINELSSFVRSEKRTPVYTSSEEGSLPNRIISAKGFGEFIEAFYRLEKTDAHINDEIDRVWDCIRAGTSKQLLDCSIDKNGLERDYKIAMYELWESLRKLASELIPIEDTVKNSLRLCHEALVDSQKRES